MSKFAVVFAIALGFAIVSTAFAGAQLVSHPQPQTQNALGSLSTTTAPSNSSDSFSFGAGAT